MFSTDLARGAITLGRIARLFAAMFPLLLALLVLPACGGSDDDAPSQPEYLAMVDGWMEQELSIRERAAIAAGEPTNEGFPVLIAESEALRDEIAETTPPEGCETLHDAFLAPAEHFVDALTMLSNGEDLDAIDEITLANTAKQEMKDELARLTSEAE